MKSSGLHSNSHAQHLSPHGLVAYAMTSFLRDAIIPEGSYSQFPHLRHGCQSYREGGHPCTLLRGVNIPRCRLQRGAYVVLPNLEVFKKMDIGFRGNRCHS
jgi:hypothetical protein